MTDLQLSLLALGAIIIVAVMLFNWWQERRLRKEISERMDNPGQDALMGDFPIDAEAILKDEPSQPKPVANAQPFPLASSEAEAEHFDYESTVADAVSAVAEFEQDMAITQPEVVPASAVTQYSASWDKEPASPPVTATREDLMQEAGLDDASAIAGSDMSATEPVAAVPTTPIINHLQQMQALPPEINQQIDLIALLYLPQAASGAVLREFLLDLGDIDKPIYAFGIGLDQNWHMLTQEQEQAEFNRAVCSLQLADRSGQITNTGLSRFQHAVASMGQKLGAQVEWLGDSDTLNYAAELDRFCLDVDKMVGFHLVAGVSGPFTGTKFRGLAEASGLTLREDGAFHYESETGQRLFSVVNQDGNPFSIEMLRTAVIRGITFQLDIPRVKNCAEVFNHMILTARQMENSLMGLLVDDNQRPLGETQIEKIRQQLKMIHATMVARGIMPGSALALRLFS